MNKNYFNITIESVGFYVTKILRQLSEKKLLDK
jgi:hypothetical protein